MSHKCHAHGCPLGVPPKFLFCAKHWHSTRKALQNAIWNEYRVGQEGDKDASDRYMAIQRLCVSELAHRMAGGSAVALRYAEQAEAYRQKAIAAGAGDPFEQLSRRARKSDCQLELPGLVPAPAPAGSGFGVQGSGRGGSGL
jgi:hypothetical protein